MQKVFIPHEMSLYNVKMELVRLMNEGVKEVMTVVEDYKGTRYMLIYTLKDIEAIDRYVNMLRDFRDCYYDVPTGIIFD